ncbi:protease modulator HflC [bacterium]|nr:protease modulator HflC [bacterium]
MDNDTKIASAIAAVGLFLLSSSLYMLDQTEQALVVAFGKPMRIVQTPGLKWKKPFIEDIIRVDRRLLEYNAEPKEVILADQKRLVVDAYMRYRITDPLKFYETVQDERVMRDRLNTVLESSLRQVMGSVQLQDVLSAKRGDIMHHITAIVNSQASGKPLPKKVKQDIQEQAGEAGKQVVAQAEDDIGGGFGVEVVDVRIMRADLPKENSEAIFRRMQTEREREAKEFRSRGDEEAQKIRAKADNERTVLLANAQKKADILRGEGDAQAAHNFAAVTREDPEFFAFYRSMQAYRQTLSVDDTTMVLTPKNEFLQYMGR